MIHGAFPTVTNDYKREHGNGNGINTTTTATNGNDTAATGTSRLIFGTITKKEKHK